MHRIVSTTLLTITAAALFGAAPALAYETPGATDLRAADSGYGCDNGDWNGDRKADGDDDYGYYCDDDGDDNGDWDEDKKDNGDGDGYYCDNGDGDKAGHHGCDNGDWDKDEKDKDDDEYGYYCEDDDGDRDRHGCDDEGDDRHGY